MTALRVSGIVIAVVLVVVYAAGSGRLVATSDPWYLGLQTPPWQPPGAVFGLAWAYNFSILLVVGIALPLTAARGRVALYLGTFAVSVVLALAWAWLFYVGHQPLASAIALTLAALVTVVMVVAAFGQSTWMGVVLLPYQLWLVIATSLAWGYWVLNPST